MTSRRNIASQNNFSRRQEKDGRDEIGGSPQATHQHMNSHDSPVLSEKMYCTWPSSSFRLDVRANAGVSDSALYIERSLFIKRVACGSMRQRVSRTPQDLLTRV